MRQKNNPLKSNLKVISPKILILTGVIVLVVIIFGLSKETIRKYQIQKEIESLQKEITGLENKNQELARLIEYFKTQSYQEKQARKQLDLQKEGEKVVIIPENTSETVQAFNQNQKEEEMSNPFKWWGFLFGQKK